MTVKMKIGKTVITRGALRLLERHGKDVLEYLFRHLEGDWGDLGEEDWKANDHALENDLRILSSYDVEGETLFIITEHDRSVTTILIPSEY